jgi:alanine racemase
VRRGITAEIDLDAALKNLELLREAVNGLPVIAVVKADAYGHGAAELARLYEDAEVPALAVAFVPEAEELREAGIKAPILVLFDNTEHEKYLKLNLTPVIHDMKAAEAFSREAEKRGVVLDVHIKVDTGMGRVGFNDEKEIIQVLDLKNLNVVGLMSHLSEADLADMEFVDLQLKRFNVIKQSLHKKGLKPMCHIANSAAVLACPDAHLDAVRPGLALYGISPFAGEDRRMPALRPMMRAKARILTVRRLKADTPVSYSRTFITKRPTLAAALAVGYADGYNRLFSNSASVLIRGKRAPVIGRVCMDLTMADVTDIGEVSERDEVVLLGRDGDENITARELAEKASTIPYEILSSFGKNARRLYSRIPISGEHPV